MLARRAVEPDMGLWDPVGGFLEEGEHPLDGIRREVEEETGLRVRADSLPRRLDGRLRRRARSRGDPESLLGDAHRGGGEPVAADDVAELRWFAPDELPGPDELAFTHVPDALDAWRSFGTDDAGCSRRTSQDTLLRPRRTKPGRGRASRGGKEWEEGARRRREPSERSIAPFGCAPITAADGSPSLKRIIVGIEATP